MRKRLYVLIACMAAMVACQNRTPVVDMPVNANTGRTLAERPLGYVALPGRAATSTTLSETNAAIEYAAAAYGHPAAMTQPPVNATTQAAQQDMPSPTSPVWRTVSSAPGAPYSVQVSNGTSGRLFIEATDEGDNIFPFGFMNAGQRVGALPQNPHPIQGRIVIVVRDPDQPGAPEIRRYYVNPPAGYEGKTIGITILPGGRYRATLDGKVYYTSPEPVTPTAAPAA